MVTVYRKQHCVYYCYLSNMGWTFVLRALRDNCTCVYTYTCTLFSPREPVVKHLPARLCLQGCMFQSETSSGPPKTVLTESFFSQVVHKGTLRARHWKLPQRGEPFYSQRWHLPFKGGEGESPWPFSFFVVSACPQKTLHLPLLNSRQPLTLGYCF